MESGSATVLAAAIGAVGTIGAVIIGKLWGSRGKKKGIEKLTTDLQLDRTAWRGTYTDQFDEEGRPERQGDVHFRQYGSRVVGEAKEAGNRRWLLEGVASRRRVCYVYVDADTNRLSIGTAALELDADGDTLTGQWMGWSPDGDRLEPQSLRLERMPSCPSPD